MKKFIYALVLVIFSSAAMISCTEEEVSPSETKPAGGGGVSADLLK